MSLPDGNDRTGENVVYDVTGFLEMAEAAEKLRDSRPVARRVAVAARRGRIACVPKARRETRAPRRGTSRAHRSRSRVASRSSGGGSSGDDGPGEPEPPARPGRRTIGGAR